MNKILDTHDTDQTPSTCTSEYHRDARTGFIIPLSAVHVKDVTPTMQQEIRESSKYRSIHTSRIQACLQTQIINYFKGPGASLSLFRPNPAKVIDLGSLQLQEKPAEVRGWTRDGWAFRWDTEAIRLQLGYDKKTTATIDLDKVIYFMFAKLRYVWVPKPKANQKYISSVARIDPFTNFNNIKTIPNLDAAYFNISSAFIEELICNDQATVIYHRQIRSKLRSETAQQIASIILTDFDLSPVKSKVKSTSLLDQQFYVDQLYQGDKKLDSAEKALRLKWALFVRDCITRHIKRVRDAFGFSSLRFVTNGKRGKDMLGWFEFSWPEGGQSTAASLVALSKDIPELAHPDLFSANDVARYTTSVNPPQLYTWNEVLELAEFIEESQRMLASLGIATSALNDIVIAYSSNALRQMPKTVKRWLSPFRIWVRNRQERLKTAVSVPVSGDHSATPTLLDQHTSTTPATTARANRVPVQQAKPAKKPRAVKVLFSADLVDDKVLTRIHTMLSTGYSDFLPQYDQETDDYIRWNIPKFSAYHMTYNGTGQKNNRCEWQKLFTGWMRNAFDNPKSLKEFRTFRFDVKMLTETQPFSDWFKQFPEHIVKVMLHVLKMLEITYPEDRKSVGAWQRQAWSWLKEDRSLKELGISVPAIFLGDQPSSK